MKSKLLKILSKIVKTLKSRTFWTLIATLLFNCVSLLGAIIPSNYLVIGNAILMILATYFHINPSQSYSHKIEKKILSDYLDQTSTPKQDA